MTHQIKIPGYRLKDGKLVKTNYRKDVSARLRERGSKKITVKRKGAIMI
jgi:hypothetical protein